MEPTSEGSSQGSPDGSWRCPQIVHVLEDRILFSPVENLHHGIRSLDVPHGGYEEEEDPQGDVLYGHTLQYEKNMDQNVIFLVHIPK